ncbi:MAG: CDP-glucose 4,6-dehydratase [Ardenticatenaceae bacterium]|nr:CDP-glucose 4,6-dehydratase [Ardenticatenaceae bacterium]
MNRLFEGVYSGRSVLITGHTGFKGAWLTTWLLEMGARVIGYSLPEPPTEPNMFDVLGLAERVTDVRGDIRHQQEILALIEKHRPSIIFHMAAQPIVLRSIEEPQLTIATNTMGTVNLLDAVRQTAGVDAVVSITTDKVYEDHHWLWGYREIDRLGGKDPYSASKAMAELAIHTYRQTYFHPDRYPDHGVGLASVRAGNVIGGGDLAPFRLVPDSVQALMRGEPIPIRNPYYVRPWQHVLVPLSGYLEVGRRLLTNNAPHFSEPWNFGPLEQVGITVQEIADKLIEIWGDGSYIHTDPDVNQIETFQLRLSWEKAAQRLGWRPVYSWIDALEEIVAWFKAYDRNDDMLATTQSHIHHFVSQATAQGAEWADSINQV